MLSDHNLGLIIKLDATFRPNVFGGGLLVFQGHEAITHDHPLWLEAIRMREALEKIAYDGRDPMDEPGEHSDLRAAWEWRQIAIAALAGKGER